MNYLLLPSECTFNESFVHVDGASAAALINKHELRRGREIGIVKRGVGTAAGLVIEVTESHLIVECEKFLPPPPRLPIEVIVAVPRPPAVRKIIHAATTLGITRVIFVSSAVGEKSYLQSTALFPEEIQDEIDKAIEQCGDPIAPIIEVKSHLQSTIQKSSLLAGTKIVADSRGLNSLVGTLRGEETPFPAIVAIGPEKGWTAAELALFQQLGFKIVTLGARVLRVEIAFTVSMAQMYSLRDYLNPDTPLT